MSSLREISERINDYMESGREDIAELLTQLIGINSVSKNENDIAEFLLDKMYQFEFDEAMIDPVGNVLGRIGIGKTVIVYDAHLDTVELGAQEDWEFDPVNAQREGDIIRGRGAVDDKACVAGMLYAAKAIKALGLNNDFTLWVCGSIAEETVTGSALAALLEECPDIQPDFILVGEPSESRIIRGHKGKALINITVPGKCAHAASAHMGENALKKCVPVLDGIAKLESLPSDSFLGQSTIEPTAIHCESPSVNTIPGEAVITCDWRLACGETPEKLREILTPILETAPGTVMNIIEKNVTTYTGYEISAQEYCPSWVMPEEHKIVRSGVETFKRLFKKEPIVGKWDFCTNATFVCGKMGIPCLGFGPGDGLLCHSTDERMSITEMVDAAKFYALFALVVSESEG